MSGRREFFKTVLGGALAAIPARSPSLFAEDAGALKVEPGVSLPVRVPGARIEYLRLVMPDGVRLAATLYLPETLEGRIPAILEVLPYRKDDDYLGRDTRLGNFLIACVAALS